ncbi:MAG: AbrB/MazE/SpoVT family DNA-binding domain-containing protein [archaeon]|nr:AbrB/MazE/SpoVT family DNA-binding domain-containing protein [archaeon]
METEITRISSKGQVVIPLIIREKMKIKEGEAFAVSEKGNLIVLKKIEGSLREEDIETLNRIKEAWADVEQGKYKKMSKNDFLKEISQW